MPTGIRWRVFGISPSIRTQARVEPQVSGAPAADAVPAVDVVRAGLKVAEDKPAPLKQPQEPTRQPATPAEQRHLPDAVDEAEDAAELERPTRLSLKLQNQL